ncbi:MAG: hypothetical protein JW867_08250, partial [Candidatus Omnitrophica bacterium]|nr:hypothetical protein [Candidatus Omnitrophota bacterium]
MHKIKWALKGGILLLFLLLVFYGNFIVERVKASHKPETKTIHIQEAEQFIFDKNLNAYKGFDQANTIFIDDPAINKDTIYGQLGDLTQPKPLTIEDIRNRKPQEPDDYEIKGKTIRDRDDSNVIYIDK